MGSPSKKILFAPSNENQTRILVPVARFLRDQKNFEVEFITFDRYYAQNAGRVLVSTDFSWMPLPCSHFVGDWCVYEQSELVPFLREAKAGIRAFLRTQKPDAVVVGNDTGVIEQLLLRAAEQLDIPTARIQDGFQASPELDASARSAKVVIGDGGCDLNCVWSKAVCHEMGTRGVHCPIVVTGNPRYDALANRKRPANRGATIRVLLAAQCFARYGEMSAIQEISLYERLIRLMLKRPDIHIVFKLHPQTDLVQQYVDLVEDFGPRVELVREGDSLETLQLVDAVVTVSSTVSVEAALLGLPVCRLNYVKGRTPDFVAGEAEFLSQVYSKDFPQSLNYGIPNPAKFVRRHMRQIDGTSTARVAHAIEQLLQTWNSDRPNQALSQQPTLSIIIPATAQELLSTIRSALHQRDVALEVLVPATPTSEPYARAVAQHFADPRLKIVTGANSEESIDAALRAAQGRYIGRAEPGVILLPGWAKSVVKALERHTDSVVALSPFALRDEEGIFSTIITLDANQPWSELVIDPARKIACQAYAFRATATPRALASTSHSRDGWGFIRSLLGTETLHSRIIINQCLFLSGAPDVLTLEDMALASGEHSPPNGAHLKESESQFALSVIVPRVTSRDSLAQLIRACTQQSLSRDKFEIVIGTGRPPTAAQESILPAMAQNDNQTWIRDCIASLAPKDLNIRECASLEVFSTTQMLAAYARGRTLLLLSDDMHPEPECFQAHVDFHGPAGKRNSVGLGKILASSATKREIFSLALAQHDVWPGFSLGSAIAVHAGPFAASYNMSIPRDALLRVDQPLRSANSTLIGEDLSLGFRLWESGYRRLPVPSAQVLFLKTPTVQDYLQRELNLSIQTLELLPTVQDPEKRRLLVGSDQLEPRSAQQWAETSESLAPTIADIVQSVDSIQHHVASGHSPAAIKAAAELVKEVADAVLTLGHYARIKAFSSAMSVQDSASSQTTSVSGQIQQAQSSDATAFAPTSPRFPR